MLFSYGNIYLLYIYFCKSHKVQPAQLVRKENACRKDQVPLFPATWVRFVPVAVGFWLKKEKKIAFKNDHVKRGALLFPLALLSSLAPCVLPACCYTSHASLQGSASPESWELWAPTQNQ